MATKYEMIMDLPLFKGVGKDHVSLFLEKTHLNFINFNPGDTVVEEGEDVRMVRFVISGEVNIIHTIGDLGLLVEERAGFGRVLGAARLFGFDTGYPYKVVAATRISIMEFSKEQYMNLINSDRIYLLNYLNYLSLRAQRPTMSTSRYWKGTILNKIRRLIFLLTDPNCKSVKILGDDFALAQYCGCTSEEIDAWKDRLSASGFAECDEDTVNIFSRSAFLE